MPKVKHYTANREMRMDCGHTVKAGEPFHVTSVFTCDREGAWPLRVLMACFAPRGKAQPDKATKKQENEQAENSAPANPPATETKA